VNANFPWLLLPVAEKTSKEYDTKSNARLHSLRTTTEARLWSGHEGRPPSRMCERGVVVNITKNSKAEHSALS